MGGVSSLARHQESVAGEFAHSFTFARIQSILIESVHPELPGVEALKGGEHRHDRIVDANAPSRKTNKEAVARTKLQTGIVIHGFPDQLDQRISLRLAVL